MKARHRASGGKAQVVSGNKNVIQEAEEGTTGDDDKVSDRKRGGGMKKKRATGGKVIGRMTGGAVAPRGDRPRRATGGGVGANRSPLSTAHGTTSPKGSSNPQDSYGGTPK